jgi:molybdenum cofactor cytidylyltransferase
MQVAIIILAAGASFRLGQSKQLIPYKGEFLLRRICKAAIASKSYQTIVVLGSNAAEHKSAIQALDLSITENPDWALGMGNSLKHGLKHLLQLDHPDAVIISVCDQPFLEASTFDALIGLHEKFTDKIIACQYQLTFGVPVLFPQKYFDALHIIADGAGAKQMINTYKDDLINYPFEAGSIDIDHPADLERLMKSQIQ